MLTDMKIRKAQPKARPYKLYDSGGLYIYILPTGTKSWRYDYRFGEKRKTLTIGRYPSVSLKEARFKRDEAKRLLSEGNDPSSASKFDSSLFKEVATAWFEMNRPKWSDNHAKTIRYRLNLYILPAFGERRIDEIKRREVLHLMEVIKKTGKIETARRVNQITKNIFEYAIDMELINSNPAYGLSKYVESNQVKHYPTITEPDKIGELLIKIENYRGNFIVKSALKLLILTFVRPGELRHAKWDEFNLNEGIWDIPPERMKIRRPHRVFLSKQALDILNFLKEIPAPSEYIFRGRNPNKPISENTLNKALRTMGYDTKTEITAHGFRAMARTLLHEKLGYAPEIIEHQLAHRVPDVLGEAYNRTRFYEQRKEMMQRWADYLVELSYASELSGNSQG